MANLESPEIQNLQEFEFRSLENAQYLEVVSIDLPLNVIELDTTEDSLNCANRNLLRSEVQLSLTRNNLKRKAPVYHKGVRLKQSNNKFAARLCLPGPGKGKLDLGEYQSHEEAARAYDIGAFYYQKLECNCLDRSIQDKLPPAPVNVSELVEKSRWVRDRARQFAPFDDSERCTTVSDKELVSGCNSLFTSLEGQPSASPGTPGTPGTPASYCTQEASCGYPTDAPTLLTSASGADNFLSGWNDHDVEFPIWDLDVTSEDRRKRKAAPHVANNTTRIPTSLPVSHRGLTNLEEQQERNTEQTPSADEDYSHQAVPQLEMTDSIFHSHCELRKQGWKWTLKPRSPSSVKTGLLFSLPQGQQVPELLMTDIIISTLYELRTQGWEVHLEASKRHNIKEIL